MKKLVFCIIPLLVASSVVGQTPSRGRASVERYIRDSEAQWAESVATGDTSAIQRILADDFMGVDTDGNLYDKAQAIAETKNAPKYFVSNHIGLIKIRFFGNTAVAQGSESWVRRNRERGRCLDRHLGIAKRPLANCGCGRLDCRPAAR
jgi:hypothetical protein